MSSHTTRRDFIKDAALAVGFIGLQTYMAGCSRSNGIGYGPLLEDPNQLLKLPKGFSYSSFSKTGELMDDGLFVPGDHDGMAAFPLDADRVILVRNHEMGPGNPENGPFKGDAQLLKLYREKHYDAAHDTGNSSGGTSTLIFNTKTQQLEQHSLSLLGTIRNCSGGPTPWGSWVTCEETNILAGGDFEKDHGYCFEVPASEQMGLALPVPIKGMGRFNHEAIAVDPKSGIVYLTEDRGDGLIYRYIPNEPGKLINGGKLQALAIIDKASCDTRNWPKENQPEFPIGTPVSTKWIDLEDIDAPKDDLRHRGFITGAARFARGEGMHYGNGSIYFACTNGGPQEFGQIFKYTPSVYEGTERESELPGELELFVESHDSQLMQACDNLTVAPWGDIVIVEDDNESSAIVGITPQGELYQIGHVAIKSELAGACFSPDGSTLFVNIQKRPGQTLAITGPWNRTIPS
ncbi:alkaline phosphatase PhoX [Pelagicoccus sp. SDUM812005]|uniref:alkaline phosphatase PhoX n=1 Tax=Pelagicoccus sp. SDUM812005 TaxID=3041257 RepID=UPI00280F3E3D|nr:alkaline phosphatase PhoX [Pelagicoccus sp. SDUM812005]MDQ8179495.1 DUF839 domain-containing protein [Pelagicoccus sp. SDUM812005]